MPSKYSDAQKQKALAMAEAATVREASEETGIPTGTIKCWRSKIRQEKTGQRPQPNRPSKNIEKISEEATERAKEEIAKHIAEKGKDLAERLLETAEEARKELLEAIKDGKDADESNAGWVRAVTGAMNYCIKTKNELIGENDQGDTNVNFYNSNTNVQQDSPEESRNRLVRRINSLTTTGAEGNGDSRGNGDI